jgi:hypothetical protein
MATTRDTGAMQAMGLEHRLQCSKDVMLLLRAPDRTRKQRLMVLEG